MNDLLQLLKELKVPASEANIFIIPLNNNSDYSSAYQLELDLEHHSKEK